MDGIDVPDRLPPQNLEAEQCVLGSMLLDRECIGDVLLFLTAKDFYMPSHSEVFSALVDLFERNEPVDLLLCTEELKRREKLELVGGVELIVSLMESVPSAAHSEAYAKLVRQAAERRSLVAAANAILKDAYTSPMSDTDELLDRAERSIFAVAQDRGGDSATSMHDLVREALSRIDRLQDGEVVTGGLPTHYSDLDKLLNGLKPGSLYIIAGRPSMGKSSFATSILSNVCIRDKTPAVLFTLEVTKEQVAENMLCSNAAVDAHRLMRGELSNEEYARVPVSAGKLSQAPLFVDDTPGITMTRLRAKARRLKSRHDIGIILVDYLQLMTLGDRAESRQVEISMISASLKQLARELKVPVVALSQLNRGVEQRQDKRPLMGDLRESGSLEQDADAILLLYRREYYFPEDVAAKGKADVIVAKNRNGPTGSIELNFHASWMRFENAHHFPEAGPPSMPSI
jgi:replicative DNA helicase